MQLLGMREEAQVMVFLSIILPPSTQWPLHIEMHTGCIQWKVDQPLQG